MKKIALLVVIATLCACQGQPEQIPLPTPKSKYTAKVPKDDPTAGLNPQQLAAHQASAAFHQAITLGQPAEITATTTHKIAGTNDVIEFIKVNKDSRCPSGVQCVWAGEVEVELKATSEGKSDTLTLGEEPITWKTYLITMKDVLPHPSAGPPVGVGMPRLLLQVDKAGKAVAVGQEIPGTAPTAAAPAQITAGQVETPTKALVPVAPVKLAPGAQPGTPIPPPPPAGTVSNKSAAPTTIAPTPPAGPAPTPPPVAADKPVSPAP